MKRLSQILLSALFAVAGSVHAIDAIPEQPGWSGFVTVGAGGLWAQTNMVAGIDKYSITIGDARIDAVGDDPAVHSTLIPQLLLNIKYTFSTQTQVFLGNDLQDIVRLDNVSIIGVRQQFADSSILELSLVSTPVGSPVQVWADPYVVGVDRVETDRSSVGLRLEYDKILGSGFGLQYTQRTYDIDNELSGTTAVSSGGVGLAPAEAELLKREGTAKRLVGYYGFPLVGRNKFELRLGYQAQDRDGKAMANDKNEIALVYAYLGKRFITAANISYARSDYDAVNPVFNKTQEDDTLGLGLFVFDKGLFNSKNWWGQLTAVWLEQQSNIDFYDESSLALMLGVQYRF